MADVQVFEGDGVDRWPRQRDKRERFPPRGPILIDSTDYGEVADVLIDKVSQTNIGIHFEGDACHSDLAKALEDYRERSRAGTNIPANYKFSLSFLFEGRRRTAYGCFIIKAEWADGINGLKRLSFTAVSDKIQNAWDPPP